jgi:hypothetical protein
MLEVILNESEIASLFIQPAETKGDGGFQSLLVGFQERIARDTGKLTLSDRDLERISMYAFDYGNGGWENRLLAIFGRNLGDRLNRRA